MVEQFQGPSGAITFGTRSAIPVSDWVLARDVSRPGNFWWRGSFASTVSLAPLIGTPGAITVALREAGGGVWRGVIALPLASWLGQERVEFEGADELVHEG